MQSQHGESLMLFASFLIDSVNLDHCCYFCRYCHFVVEVVSMLRVVLKSSKVVFVGKEMLGWLGLES